MLLTKICFMIFAWQLKNMIFGKKHAVPALVISCFILTSCSKGFPGDCFKSAGYYISEDRKIEGFDTIVLRDNIDLFLYPDTFDLVEVFAGENLVEKIITKKTCDNVLEIRNNNICNWIRDPNKPIEVHIHTKSLVTLKYYNGCGNIKTLSPFEGHVFELKVRKGHGDITIETNTHHAYLHFRSGTSDIYYEGNADYLDAYLSAFGRFDSRKLETRHTHINQMSSNDAYVYARERLVVEIHLQGNVYYSGNPEVHVKGRYGDGDVIPLE